MHGVSTPRGKDASQDRLTSPRAESCSSSHVPAFSFMHVRIQISCLSAFSQIDWSQSCCASLVRMVTCILVPWAHCECIASCFMFLNRPPSGYYFEIKGCKVAKREFPNHRQLHLLGLSNARPAPVCKSFRLSSIPFPAYQEHFMKMRWPVFITTIRLLSFCYGQKYDTTGYLHFFLYFQLALIDLKQ